MSRDQDLKSGIIIIRVPWGKGGGKKKNYLGEEKGSEARRAYAENHTMGKLISGHPGGGEV